MISDTTIAALATAPTPAGIAVIRLSGRQSKAILDAVFKSQKGSAITPRKLQLGKVINPQSKEILDQALAVFMPAPASYTGEDVVEFQLHGSPVLVRKLLRLAYSLGATPAEPGEFTKRAYLNNKLDLVQAEAVANLIDAPSEKALAVAREHFEGSLSSTFTELADQAKNLLAELEAEIDFPEEDPLIGIKQNFIKELNKLGQLIDELVQSYSFGHILRDGFRVLLCGPPNAGKSSILNRFLGRDRAIVTEISGTTRDLIEESALLSGSPFVFCDSAGLADTEDQVEKIGVELTRGRYAWADLVMLIVDSTKSPSNWQDAFAEAYQSSKLVWLIVNKIDLLEKGSSRQPQFTKDVRKFSVSAKTGLHFDELIDALTQEVDNRYDLVEASHLVLNERHRNCLNQAAAALDRTIQAIQTSVPVEFVSAELSLVLAALEELIGKTTSEDILDRIFSRFCIGK